MMSASYNVPLLVKRIQQRALIVGVVFTLLFAVGLVLDRPQFFHSYLFAFSFWAGISVGSLALLMLQHLTGGGWGFVIRRVLEAATRTLLLVAILFVPIIAGARWVYRWTNTQEMARTAALAEKAKYLNVPFFTIRALVYFAIWLTLAFLLNRWSLQQDQIASPQSTKRMKLISGPGMVLLIFTVTFAAIDWLMSLEPNWTSGAFGLIYGLGGILAGSVVDHLASQGSLSYDPWGSLLFAVNAGSDTVVL